MNIITHINNILKQKIEYFFINYIYCIHTYKHKPINNYIYLCY